MATPMVLDLTKDKVLSKLTLLYPAISRDILSLLLDDAEEFLLTYCNLNKLPQGCGVVLTRMVQENLTKFRSEGLTSESVGGNSVSYSTDYTESVYKALHKFKRIKTVASQEGGEVDVL